MAWPKGATRGADGRIQKPANGAPSEPGRDKRAPEFVDAAAAGNAAGQPDEPAPRAKRKEPPGGSGNASGAGKAKTQGASLDLSAAAGIHQGAHAFIAFARREPHWQLNDADAKAYGQALANALRHI